MRKMKKRQKRQMALATLVMLVASFIAIMLLTPAFNIQSIKVNGNSVLTEKDIIRASGIVTGVNIFGVSLSEAKENIKSMGYIENVKIKRSIPSTIVISVVEEVGVAYIKTEKGYAIISAEGRCIDITDGTIKTDGDKKQSVQTPNLPIITGMKNVKYKLGSIIKSENEEQLKALCECLHEFSKYGYVFDMREIDMSNINKIKFYYMSKDLCVTLGDTHKLSYKMECFGPILAEIGENPVGFIDLERLSYRKENPPRPEEEMETEQEENEKSE